MAHKMYCPSCGATIHDGMATCPSCGARLYGTDEVSGDLTRQVDDDMLTYGTYSTYSTYDAIEDTPVSEAAFASRTDTMSAYEGRQTGTATASQGATPPRRGGHGALIALVCVIAVGVIGGLAFLGLRSGAGDKADSSQAITTEPQAYTVSYETGGGERIESQEVKEGEQTFTPTDPERSGYEFAGWYTSSDYTERVVFPFEVTEDVVLYAKWEKVERANDSDDAGDSENANDSGDAKSSENANDGGDGVSDEAAETAGFIGMTSAYATSTLPVSDLNSGPYDAYCVLDGDPQTCWCEGSDGNGVGESITLSGPNQTISGFVIRSGYHKLSSDGVDLYYYNARPATIHVVANGETIHQQTLDDAGHTAQNVSFAQPVKTSSITIVVDSVYSGECADCCISEIACY